MKLIEIEASFSKPKYVTFGTSKTNLKWDGRWVYKLHSVIEEVLNGTLDREGREGIELLINKNEFIDFGRFYWAKENLPLEQVYSDELSESKMKDDFYYNESCCTKESNQAINAGASISEQIKALEAEKMKIDSKLIDLKKASEEDAFETCKAKYTKFLKSLTTEELDQFDEVVYNGTPEE